MFILKRFNAAAIAAVFCALAAPAIAATQASEAPAGASVKWWMRIVPTPERVTDEVIQQIRPGMDEGDVRALIGAPADTVRFALSRTTAWDYPYRDSWGYESVFSVTFNDDHVVLSKISVRHNS
jgi:outer membrane protein assembly factor BamE (lipoprotein component of BamABCDE complex)